MHGSTLLPDPALVRLDRLVPVDDLLPVVATCPRATVACPDCGKPATRIHSRYRRTLAARPWNGVRVCLQVQSRRWFCDQPDCSRSIFTERLPGLADRSAQRTAEQ